MVPCRVSANTPTRRKTDYYQIFRKTTPTEIPPSFVRDWFRSERMSPSIVSGMCIC